jgi:hypothetical protein
MLTEFKPGEELCFMEALYEERTKIVDIPPSQNRQQASNCQGKKSRSPVKVKD